MPGIVGLITRMPKEEALARLCRMLNTMRHESHYVTGVWYDPSLGAYAGWTARKGSFASNMPLSDDRGDVTLIFSGEDFPPPGDVRNYSEGRPNEDRPRYLIRLYEEDPKFPSSLNGRFHGILADRRRRSAILFNDRYGMHRLYYHESQEAFYFSAEAKALLAVRDELRKLDLRGLGEFLSCGCVLNDRTLFENVYVLPPGSAWLVAQRKIDRKVYFHSKEWESQSELEIGPYYETLRGVFSANLPRYFSGTEPIGVSLTGGLDTRMIMAWQRHEPGSLPCYSFAGIYRDSQDVILARRVAAACGQPYQVIRTDRQFLDRFDHYASRTVYLTDGCVDVSHSPDLYVNQIAASIAPVRMTGNYGGEVMRGVRAFKPVPPTPGLYHKDVLSQIDRAKTTYSELIRGNSLSFAVFRQAPWHHYGLLALEQTQLTLRSPYLDNDFVKTVFRAPHRATATNEISLQLIADGDPALRDIRTDRGLAGKRGVFSRACIRSFLDFTVTAEYAYDYGMPQWMARIDHCLSRLHLEKLFLGRHKFYHFRVWYRDPLSRYVQDILLDQRTLSRPYLQRNTLERLVRAHVRGERNLTTAIHKVLTLEHIHRIFIDGH